jgi:hypothetical protein
MATTDLPSTPLAAESFASPHFTATTPDSVDTSKFKQLKNEWLTSRPSESSPLRMAMHPAYLKIIGMGSAAVPLLLEELKISPDLWFVALRSITCADPVPASARGNVAEMAKAWIKWGQERSIC